MAFSLGKPVYTFYVIPILFLHVRLVTDDVGVVNLEFGWHLMSLD